MIFNCNKCCRQLNIGQVATFVECACAQCCNRVRNCDGLKTQTILKGIVANCHKGIRQIYCCKILRSIERVVGNLNHALRNTNTCELITAVEDISASCSPCHREVDAGEVAFTAVPVFISTKCVVRDSCNAIRQNNFCKAGAAPECIGINIPQRIRELQISKRGAFIECTITNSNQPCRELHFLQVGAFIEGSVADTFNCFREHNFFNCSVILKYICTDRLNGISINLSRDNNRFFIAAVTGDLNIVSVDDLVSKQRTITFSVVTTGLCRNYSIQRYCACFSINDKGVLTEAIISVIVGNQILVATYAFACAPFTTRIRVIVINDFHFCNIIHKYRNTF